jgi:outer membrane protein OmpA-like peptidoglycan-associated protein
MLVTVAPQKLAALPSNEPEKKFVSPSTDIFDKPDAADLKNEKLLNQAGEFLEKNPYSLVAVTAYTGYSGDTDKNLYLSQAQAMVVRQYLVKNFKVDDTRVKTKGMAEDKTNKTGRVEILVYGESTLNR